MTSSRASRAMAEVAPLVRRPVQVMPHESYQQIGIRSFGKGVFHKPRATGAEIGEKRVFYIEPGDLLFNIVFAWEGAVAVATATERGSIGSHRFLTCVVNRELADPRYLYWWFVHDRGREQLLRASPGGAGRNRTLGVEKLSAIDVPLPPLKEQRRIVVRLDTIAEQIAAARRLRGEAQAEREALIEAFEKNLWPETSKWASQSLASVTSYLSRGKQSEQGDSDHVLIKTQHVQQGHYVPSTLKLSSSAAAKVKPEAHVRSGDLLIACSAAGCLGRVARFEGTASASTDTHIAIARANPEIVTPDYLYAYLRGARGQFELRRRERGDWQREKVGFRLTELNLNELRAVPVPVPTFEQQARLVSCVNAFREKVNGLIDAQAETEEELEALMPSVLNKTFAD